MDFAKRQQSIMSRLKPKPIHHGQLETLLIAVPDLKLEDIPTERRQFLKDSLEQEGSNLIPLIVRRTEAYEEEEYEVVFGSDWCLIAKEVDLERVWVWVFDLTDEQANATRQEMELLIGSAPAVADATGQMENSVRQINVSLQKVLKVPETIRETVPSLVKEQFSSLTQELKQSLISEIRQELKQSLMNELSEEFRQSLVQDIVRIIKPPPPSIKDLEEKVKAEGYEALNSKELKVLAKGRGLKGYSKYKMADLRDLVKQATPKT